MFYIDVGTLNANTLFCRRVVDGKKEDIIVDDFKPVLFTPTNKKTGYTDMFGNPMLPREFDNISKMREFLKMAGNSNMPILGMQNVVSQYITKEFPKVIKYVPSWLKCTYFDIETSLISEDTNQKEFPDPQKANHEITAMTFYTKDSGYICFTTLDYNLDWILNEAETKYNFTDMRIKIVKCKDEQEMLYNFIAWWENNDTDVFTAWNSTEFDLPYIYNRIWRRISESYANRLSQFKRCRKTALENKFKKYYDKIDVYGRAHLDMLEIYQKFVMTKHPNYKLDTIAEAELGIKKVDYSEYSDLEELMINDPSKYVLYNIIDVKLLVGLDAKTKLIDVSMMMAMKAHSLPEKVTSPVALWDNLIYNKFHHEKKVIPSKDKYDTDSKIKGAFVKEPIKGKLGWGGSLDASSMYPSAIITNNISPETLLSIDELPDELKKYYGLNKVRGFFEEEDFMKSLTPLLKKYDVTYTANGAFYKKNSIGFYPQIMDWFLSDRDKAKTEKKQWEQIVENIKKELHIRGK